MCFKLGHGPRITGSNPISTSYTYDALNRITGAVDNTTNYNLSNVTYDKNGNIQTLQRKGVGGTIDNLNYDYLNGGTSNRLAEVVDATNNAEGFTDDGTSGDDYAYDQNGNMTSDANKGITAITYNHLNLPEQVTVNHSPDGGSITYVYDATGTKLEKTVSGSTTGTTEYAGNYIYENNVLHFFRHPEGYVSVENGNYEYVYQYKDHLGNVRLTYSDSNNDGSIDASNEIISEKNYYPFGLEHRGYNNVVSPNANSVAEKFKYNGVEFEEALGLDLYETYARGYDPALGRFMQIDPLGELIQQIDKSPYNFAWNNPIAFNDPLGLCPDCPDPSGANQGDTYTIDNGSVYVFNNGEWERQTVYELDEVVVTPDTPSEDTEEAGLDGAMAAVTITASTEALVSEAILAEMAAAGAELSTAAAPAMSIVGVGAIGFGSLLYISYQDPAPPLYIPENGPISTTANYQPRPSTGPPSINPPAYQPLTAEEALLISAYIDQMAEHRKNKRGSNKPKHEKGQTRKGRDRGGERGDSGRRPPRKRPPGWKGPWPPKN